MNLVGVGKERRVFSPQRAPGTNQVHVVLIGAVFECDAVLIEFLPGTVQPPILPVEVEVRWLPGTCYDVGLHGDAVDQGVLHFGGPAVLPAVAQIDVVERVALGFVWEQIPVKVARVFILEIQSERTLGLGPRPAAVDFEVEVLAYLQRAIGIKKLHAGEAGPRLPEIGAEVGVVAGCVGAHDVDAVVPVPQVVFVYQDGKRWNVRLEFIDDVDLVLDVAGQFRFSIVPHPNAQACGFVKGQSTFWKDRRRCGGQVAIRGVTRRVAGCRAGNSNGQFTIVPSRRHGQTGSCGNAGITYGSLVGFTRGGVVEDAPILRLTLEASHRISRFQLWVDGQGIHHIAVGIGEYHRFSRTQLKRHVAIPLKFRPPRWRL